MQTRKILKPRSIQTCRYPLRSRSDQQQQEQVQGQRRRQQNLVPAQIATFESSEGDWCKSTHSPVGDGYIQPQVQPQRQYVPVEPQSQQVQTNKNGSGETRQVPLDPQGFVPSKNGRDPSRLQRKRRRGEGRKFRENAPAPDISRTSGQKRSRDESSLAEESQIQADPRPAKSARTTLHAAPFQGLRHDVGFLGETEVYERFKSVLGDDWDYRNWTSHFRADAGYPEFIESEMGIADFTFTDEHGKMKSYLVSQGFGPDPKWSNKTTFHLEVKTTLKNKTGYKLSRSQRELREIARRDPNMVFLVVRMYDIEGQSGARWAFYFNDEMG
ncbi:uncharacterized protein BCR38DRAFT_191812 [Pseudomassariella vexata]|uniref:Protein NO VEIN C-terminal domain-containing protein n=1 Tax=Pseudomassariella vexata TaxID=1141098 RepID=A0A1Y2E0P7_9PEZI|nr:uncharacterized protein BCR38DRAFT_191812 [Pseudomassariella vexata]ORY65121.1 hypothetical protein BCR38DRAFT_191812 [Pseudomassariella vexata]